MKKIVKIIDLNGKDKTEGRYPKRIGTTCNIVNCSVGYPLILKYISRQGVLTTSIITKIEKNKITTLNSVYYFEDIN